MSLFERKKMKRLLFVILVLFAFCVPVIAEENGHLEGEEEYNMLVDEIVRGELRIDAATLFNKGLSLILGEVIKSKSLIVSILVIAAASGVLNVLESSFAGGENREIAFFACFTLIAISISHLLTEAVGYGLGVVEQLSGFITKICPTLTILMVSSGAAASASSFSPVLASTVYVISVIIEKIIVPLVYLSAVLGIVNNLTDKVQLGNLNRLIKSFSKWTLTAVLTIFTGINAIYGFSMPVLDTVSLKAVKFTVGSCVPVVGGLLADTVETVLGGARLMKNAVGTAGIITVVMICLVPVVKIAAIIVLLKIAAAVIEPVCDRRISAMVTDAAMPITIVFSMVLATAMLFIVSISIIISAV